MFNPFLMASLIKRPLWFNKLLNIKVDFYRDLNEQIYKNIIPTEFDGKHYYKSPFYFEWWYFDVSLNDGSAFTFIFHLRDLINPNSKYGSLNISFFRPNVATKTWFVRYPSSEIQASPNGCDVRIGKSRCWNSSKNDYKIYIEEDFIANLIFNSNFPYWMPSDGKIQFGNSSRFFAWIVPQPRANVTGYIKIKDTIWNVNGIGYHDHNWGNVSLLNTLDAWTWGRIYFEELTIIYADLYLSPLYSINRVLPFMLAHDNKIIFSSFLDGNKPLDQLEDFLFAPEKVNKPEGWTLNWRRDNRWFKINLKTRHVLEKADLIGSHNPMLKKIIELFIAHPFYIRCFTDVEGTFSFDGEVKSFKSGKAICEQIVFRIPSRR